MSILEVIVMSKYLATGLAMAVLLPISTATAASSATHKRASFFTSNQNRTDVGPRLAKMFSKLDSNRDGFITKSEIAALQAQFDERAAKSAPKRAARMFDSLDVDHDGKITQAEATATRAKRRRSLVVKADANKDGVVTRAEYNAAAASGKIKVRHAAMRGSLIVRLFDGADLDKDGRVSLSEAQQAALKEFDSGDTNHDGVLTPEERRQAAKAKRANRATT
jgi:Ca2+-binding EF-hand superfamily protein